jgi:hypothetical protein
MGPWKWIFHHVWVDWDVMSKIQSNEFNISSRSIDVPEVESGKHPLITGHSPCQLAISSMSTGHVYPLFNGHLLCRPDYYCGLFRWTGLDKLILSADCSVTWSWHTNSDRGLFRLHGLDIPDVDFGYTFLPDTEIGLTAGVTGQQRMLTSPWHLILPLHLSGVHVAPHLILYLPFVLWLRLTHC